MKKNGERKDQVQVPQWHHFWTLAYEVNHEDREVTLDPKTTIGILSTQARHESEAI